MKPLLGFALVLAGASVASAAEPIVLPGGEGIGKGKHIVLVSGDQEYRSEETIPQLAKILNKHHGFKCTVLFTVDKNGHINPDVPNIPGLEALKSADLLVLFTRMLDLPDDQMKHFVDYVEAGKPVVGLRTATHPFDLKSSKTYAKWTWTSKEPGYEGGFGRQVLGETWVAHHGHHGKEGTRGIVAPGQEKNPILKGIETGSIFGTTDVYTVNLPKDCTPVVLGQVTETLEPTSKAVAGKKNDPMMPVAWTRAYPSEAGALGRVFTTTMGASQDFAHEGTRRLVVNGCLYALGMADRIPDKTDVAVVGTFEPTPFKFGGHKKGVTPAELFK
ncbi:MAG: ThuA domain-containing protein [Gemmataceae bacterium]|nr:ThuA domain-containing protein [Gemmataceae bacterium]